MRISYLIGSYSTDLMGNAHHEEVIHALQARGVEIEVLTLIAERGAPALECREIHGVPVWQINALAGRGAGAGLLRRVSARLFHYEHFLTLVRAARAFYARHPYDLLHAEAAYPFAAAALLAFPSVASAQTLWARATVGPVVVPAPSGDGSSMESAAVPSGAMTNIRAQ